MVTRVRPQPLTDRPRVSVVVPCYNYGHFLPACVRSVLDQTGVDVDVLIVDDASPDGSAAVAHRLAEEDPRVRVIAHEVNRRHIATYNEGLAAVDGEFVLLLSADDMLAPGSLARSAAVLRARPDVTFVYGFSPSFADEPPPARTTVRSWSIWPGREWVEQMCRRMSNPVATPEVVMRNSVMRELVGYDDRLPHAADFLLWLRAAARGEVARINGADQAFYRHHGGNMHMEMYAGVHTDLVQRRLTFEVLFEQDATFFPPDHDLLAVAMRSLAREALTTVVLADAAGDRDEQARAQLVAFAEEVWPRDRDPQLWRLLDRRRVITAVPPRFGWRLVRRAVDDVTGRVRWRQWRRTGLMSPVGSVGSGR